MLVLIRMCIFGCLLIRKMKISISFGDVFDRKCHRKRLSTRKVYFLVIFGLVIFRMFRFRGQNVSFRGKNANFWSKKVTRGRIFSKKYFVLTYIVIWALSKSEWKKNLFKRTNSNIEVGYPAPIFFWKFSQFCQIYHKILFTTHQSKILENWITFSALWRRFQDKSRYQSTMVPTGNGTELWITENGQLRTLR